MKVLLFIGAGSFVGGITRFYLSKVIQEHYFISFPLGTFTVNVIGSFLIGLFFGLSEKMVIDSEWRLFLTTGFCGSFTTFSTFANENLEFIRDGDFLYFFLYTFLSLLIGFTAVFFGRLLIKFVLI